MQCSINGHEYTCINNALNDNATRMSYFKLAKISFGLDFEKWHQSPHWENRFIPAVILDGDVAVSSVAVCINDITWKGQQKRYVQISTVMTLPEYRNKGLNRYLMDVVLNEWKDKCDAMYLLANDSVVNFYPKFGFELAHEFRYCKSIKKTDGGYRKLDINNPDDWRLIIKKYELGNPFSEIPAANTSLFVFHCMHAFQNDIYYMEKYDAVAIVKLKDDRLHCYDIFTDSRFGIDDLLNCMAGAHTKEACLGFTPLSKEGFIVEESNEEDTHLFVLKDKENIFKNNKVMLPVLSRA